MKNILVFTYGDASNPATWSNVPFLLTNALEKKGYNVIRYDMSTKQNPFTLLFSLCCKIIKPKTTFYFVRSNWNRKIVEKKIKKAVLQYDNSVDLYISISYDFSPSKYTNKKVLLLSDWPIEYALERRYHRSPDFLEQQDIKRHKDIIESATYRVSLFQDVANYMNQRFRKKTVYLGGLINSFYPIDGFEEIDHRNNITFIGKKSYYKSALMLIKAFQSLDQNLIQKKHLELHIIGMTQNDFKSLKGENIYFHGYLDKGKQKERDLYYHILKETIVIVNTNDKWAGMSSIIESMYYYRPIITSKYEEFIETFGENIPFGFYSDNNEEDVKISLEKVLTLPKPQYQELSEQAHKAVKDFTYDFYVDQLINLVSTSKK